MKGEVDLYMNKEIEYTKNTELSHIKEYGQYFTNYTVAEFMCNWACKNAKRMLDPAVGNSVFLKYTKIINPACDTFGYEIDKKILDFFGNPTNSSIRNEDYLLNGWDEQYDAIVCNPPYNRFQAIGNRTNILETIFTHTGIKYSSYTNLYVLFLIKSIFQLSPNGKLAYIIPSEFLNSKYGDDIKKLLITNHLLRTVINFENNNEMFSNATTTCCILLVDRDIKSKVDFYNLKSISELELLSNCRDKINKITVSMDELLKEEKWRLFINQEEIAEYKNLKPIKEYCSVSRGIATGANDYFCFSKSKADAYNIPKECLKECICHSSDIKNYIFSNSDFEKLSKEDKTVFVLNVTENNKQEIESYITHGEEMGVNKKYLCSCRNPWYSMEQKKTAPIWVTSACRETIKFVRNLSGISSLTTFHSIFIKEEYKEFIDIIFCYFVTPIAQQIIRLNRKELGNGLDKFQPNDMNKAGMIDLDIISNDDKREIISLYENMKKTESKDIIEKLNDIFKKYVI